MGDLNKSISKTLIREGLYSNDPDDPGGETWRGISRKYHPEWAGWTAIDAAKAAGADPRSLRGDPALVAHTSSFYRSFVPAELYEGIEDQEVLDELFDFGFNVDPPNAVRALQETLRSIEAGPLVVDGKFGPGTLAAINAAEPAPLLREFRARQADYYVESVLRRFVKALRDLGISLPAEVLAKASKFATKYALGWLRRVME